MVAELHTECFSEYRFRRRYTVKDPTLPEHDVLIGACRCCRTWWPRCELNAYDEALIQQNLGLEIPGHWSRLHAD